MIANDEQVSAAVREIGMALSEQREQLAREMAEAVIREDADAAASFDAIVANCATQLKFGLPRLADGYPEAEALRFIDGVYRQLSREGVPLQTFLHRMRLGHQVLLAAVTEQARNHPTGLEATVLIAQRSLSYEDAVSNAVVEIYFQEQRRVIIDADRLRRNVLERLLAGDPNALARAEEAGVLLRAEGPCHVLVAGGSLSRSAAADEHELGIAAEETTSVFAEHAPLVAVRGQRVTAILCGESGAIPARASELAARCTARGVSMRIAISLPCADLGALADAHEQAERAFTLTSERAAVVVLGDLSAREYLLATADGTARSLVRHAAQELASSTAAADIALIQTLDAYLASGLNVQRAASMLPAHPNTVYSRLRRLGERTSCDVRDARQLMELATEIALANGTKPADSAIPHRSRSAV